MSSIAHWIGGRAADVVAFFRDKPFVPCQVDWDGTPPWAPPPTPPRAPRPDVQAVFNRNIYDTLRDDCDSCDEGCCVATDTLAEFREWNQRQ